MKNITLIKVLDLEGSGEQTADKEVGVIFNGTVRRLVEVRLQNGATLARHHAKEPITVLCVAGAGIFNAGAELEESQEMRPGTLITLEAGVDHEVVARASPSSVGHKI